MNSDLELNRRYDIMKIKLLAVLTVICTVISVFGGISAFADTAVKTAETDGFITMSSDKYNFTLNTENGCFTVKDLKTGNIYRSNPENADPSLTTEALYSQLTVEYFSASNQIFTFNSYEHSSKLGNITAKAEDNKISVEYVLGKMKIDRTVIPNCYTEKDFKEFLKTDGIDKNIAESIYEFVDKENIYYEDYLESYPLLKKQPLYVLDQYAPDYKIEKLYYQMKDAGFNHGKLEEHNEKYGLAAPQNDNIQITVAINYELCEQGFKATVDCDKISVDGNATLTAVYPLPYYEAAFGSEEGYMLLPDGSGALINFSNDRLELGDVAVPLYGSDDALTLKQKTEYTPRATIPIFGISRITHGTLAVIEKGDALATVYGTLSGRAVPVCTAYTGFTLRPYEMITLDSVSTNTSYNIYSSESYDGDISILYILLDSDNSSYSKMAAVYREYLTENGCLNKNQKSGYPLSVEFLGAIGKSKNFLGIPYTKTYALTTLDDALSTINRLKAGYSEDLTVKYTGWCNGGLVQKYANKISLVSKIGNKKEFESFNNTLESWDITCYYGIYLQQINQKLVNTRVNVLQKGVKCLYNDVASKPLLNLATTLPLTEKTFETNQNEPQSYMLSPKYLSSLAKKADSGMKKLGAKYTAYEDLGSLLYSDFSKKNYSNRQESLENIRKALDSRKGFSVSGGDIYTLKNAEHIYNMSLTNSRRLVYDSEVPFTQMVLHGYVSYSSEAINLSDDPDRALLKSVETGAVLHYTFAGNNTEQLKNSDYNKYYSVLYDAWSDSIENHYHKIASSQKKLASQLITEHRYLSKDVTLTVYEDGTQVVVNYGAEPFEFGGEVITSMNYHYFNNGGI